MSGMLAKMGPTAAVFAMVAWCCWPHLDAPHHAGAFHGNTDAPRIATALLCPTFPPPGDRDPFGRVGTEVDRPPKDAQPQPPLPRQEGPLAENGGRQQPDADPFKDLVLDGILIRGDRRVALINGRVCEQGQPLPMAEPGAGTCTVEDIGRDAVRLIYRGEAVELKYTGASSRGDRTEPRGATP